MLNYDELHQALRSALPDQDNDQISQFTTIIINTINNQSSSTKADKLLGRHPSILSTLETLSGKSINTNSAVLAFGEDNQFGDISIRDTAGRDIVNITLNFYDTEVNTLSQIKQQYQKRLDELNEKLAQSPISKEISEINSAIAKIEGDLRKDKEQFLSSRLVVISSPKQVMELRSAPDGLELYLHDVRPRHDKGLRWRLSKPELINILNKGSINVRGISDRRGLGFFDIGPRKEWYYSLSLFPKPIDLHTEIRQIIEKIINQ